jgi:hypothetical protein
MVFGVFGVGIDFRPCLELEACLLNQGDRHILSHIARSNLLGLRLVGSAPVVNDAKNSSGLAMSLAIRFFLSSCVGFES